MYIKYYYKINTELNTLISFKLIKIIKDKLSLNLKKIDKFTSII